MTAPSNIVPPCPALPPVIGHRGAAALAPENTLAGFREAKRLGCSWVEFDVRLTADRVPVVCHDSGLRRTTGGHGVIARLPLAMVRAYDAGRYFDPRFADERVPTLDEVLSLASELELGVNVEIKADRGLAAATAEAVADSLRRFAGRLSGILVSSFIVEALAAFRPLMPEIPTGLLLGRFAINWQGLAARLGCTTINLAQQRLTAARVARLRTAGYPVLAYTVNDPVRAQTLFEWGVTSVFTDKPDILLQPGASARIGVVE
ncbi:MAG TPA: glycerophosphoryl diester phosphodiesterase [Stellaceae bacterium]|jgi:glycerophosphoryl diester phosphodiesterase